MLHAFKFIRVGTVSHMWSHLWFKCLAFLNCKVPVSQLPNCECCVIFKTSVT